MERVLGWLCGSTHCRSHLGVPHRGDVCGVTMRFARAYGCFIRPGHLPAASWEQEALSWFSVLSQGRRVWGARACHTLVRRVARYSALPRAHTAGRRISFLTPRTNVFRAPAYSHRRHGSFRSANPYKPPSNRSFSLGFCYKPYKPLEKIITR